MNCRQCGTEIADKAIVCYRCGAPTADPVRRPPVAARRERGRGSPAIELIIAVLLLLFFALYLGFAGRNAIPREVAWAIAGIALLLLVWRRMRR